MKQGRDLILVLKSKLLWLDKAVELLVEGSFAAVDKALEHLPRGAFIAEKNLVGSGERLKRVHIDGDKPIDRLLDLHHE